MIFGERVEFELEYADISQKKLTRKTGIAESTISAGKTRGGVPGADTAVKIAKELHVSVEFLVTGNDVKLYGDYAFFAKYKDIMCEFEKVSPEKTAEVKKYVLSVIKAGQEKM